MQGLLCLLLVGEGLSLSIWTSVQVLTAVQQHHRSGCVFLLHSARRAGLYGVVNLASFQKQLAARDVATAGVSVAVLRHASGSLQCHVNQPLYVLLDGDFHTALALRHVKWRSSLSDVKWLLLLGNTTRAGMEELMSSVDIPFNCEFLVAHGSDDSLKLSEVYRVNATLPLQIASWGSWTRRDGLRAGTISLHRRRNDLQGFAIRTAYVPDPPVVMEDNNGHLSGFCYDIWKILQHKFNFSLSLVKPSDGAYGSLVGNSTWNGMVGMMQRQEVELCYNPPAFSSQRREVVAISQPLYRSKTLVLIRPPPGSAWNWNTFLSPFSPALWLGVAASALLLAASLSALHRLGRHYGNTEAQGPLLFRLVDCVYDLLGIYCVQGHWTTPSAWSCRLVFWAAHLLSVILAAAYSATLVAVLTVPAKAVLPFTTLDGLVDDGTYQCGVLGKSIYYSMFSKAEEPDMRRVFSELLEPHHLQLPASYGDGMRRACAERYAFVVGDVIAYPAMKELPCTLVELPEVSFQLFSAGFLMHPRTPYRSLINHGLEELRRNGVLSFLKHNTWDLPQEPKEISMQPIEVSNIAPLLAVLGVALLLSFLLCAGEVRRRVIK